MNKLTKFKSILNNFCNLEIFKNAEFKKLAKLKYNNTMGSVQTSNGIFHSEIDVYKNNRGIYFSFGFTINPFHNSLSALSPNNREERAKARTYIRKIFLKNDGCYLDDILNLIFDKDPYIKNDILSWIEGNWACGLVPNYEELNDNFNIKKLGKKENINKIYASTCLATCPPRFVRRTSRPLDRKVSRW